MQPIKKRKDTNREDPSNEQDCMDEKVHRNQKKHKKSCITYVGQNIPNNYICITNIEKTHPHLADIDVQVKIVSIEDVLC